MPDEERAALVAKWEAFDKTLLKDLVMDDGSIRNVDHVEYERMAALVEQMKPSDYGAPVDPLTDGVVGLGELDEKEWSACGSGNKAKKGPLLGITKQSKLKVSVAKDGKKVLGYELPKEDEGFVSGRKKKRKH